MATKNFYKGPDDKGIYTTTEDITLDVILPSTVKAILSPKVELYKEYTSIQKKETVYKLLIKKGYRWDGPSGPTLDTDNFMLPSLVHDALYQLLRTTEFGINAQEVRKAADRILYELCRSEGMSWLRAKYVHFFVRKFGGTSIGTYNSED
jgi:hypothetical protein